MFLYLYVSGSIPDAGQLYLYWKYFRSVCASCSKLGEALVFLFQIMHLSH